jgi:hypothetical protein
MVFRATPHGTPPRTSRKSREPTETWTVNLSNGRGFDMVGWKGTWGSHGPIVTGDFNGDGKTDLMMWRP